VHYGADWVKFYREAHAGRELEPIYAVQAGAIVSIHQEDAGVSTQGNQTEVDVPVLMCRSELTTESTPQYIAPADGTAIIKNIVLTNTATDEEQKGGYFNPIHVTVTLGNIVLLPNIRVPNDSMVTFDLEQVMTSGEKLVASATYPARVTLHVSGTETRRVGVGAETPDMTGNTQEEIIVKTRAVPVEDTTEDNYSPEKEQRRAEKRAAQLEAMIREVRHTAANYKHAGLSPEGVAMADILIGMEIDTP
jgi:hypothetical protein